MCRFQLTSVYKFMKPNLKWSLYPAWLSNSHPQRRVHLRMTLHSTFQRKQILLQDIISLPTNFPAVINTNPSFPPVPAPVFWNPLSFSLLVPVHFLSARSLPFGFKLLTLPSKKRKIKANQLFQPQIPLQLLFSSPIPSFSKRIICSWCQFF